MWWRTSLVAAGRVPDALTTSGYWARKDSHHLGEEGRSRAETAGFATAGAGLVGDEVGILGADHPPLLCSVDPGEGILGADHPPLLCSVDPVEGAGASTLSLGTLATAETAATADRVC